MSIFDEVKRSISSTGKQVAKRTKEISDAVSIRSQINEEKENVAKLYATVGKKVFQNATEAEEEKFFMEFTSIRAAWRERESWKNVSQEWTAAFTALNAEPASTKTPNSAISAEPVWIRTR